MTRRLLAVSLLALAAAACTHAAAAPSERTVQIRIHYSAFSIGHLDIEPRHRLRLGGERKQEQRDHLRCVSRKRAARA